MTEQNDIKNEQPDLEPKKHKGFFEEVIGESFDLDRGLLATILYMFKSPGEVIDAYFHNRGRFTNPFRYTFVILAFTTLITTFFVDFAELYNASIEAGSGESKEQMIEDFQKINPDFDWAQYLDNMTQITVFVSTKINSLMTIVIFVPFLAMFSRLFFKKRKDRFIEHFIMNLYAMTQFSLFSVITLPIMLNMQSLGQAFSLVIVLQVGYAIWVYRDYLEFSSWTDYLLGAVSALIGYFMYSIVLAIIMYVGAFIMVVYF